ncbi:uncharacterized protein LOC130960324 [Arachis stenosperma]|uniref:uncharacterized protein LOC130960324 n=1 Tax=Arachis stenosperma TaxID=217475 RepID=UPI0025AC1803|nr:uncharacterized protein LOC130960324 [Arachis stenosperma]
MDLELGITKIAPGSVDAAGIKIARAKSDAEVAPGKDVDPRIARAKSDTNISYSENVNGTEIVSGESDIHDSEIQPAPEISQEDLNVPITPDSPRLIVELPNLEVAIECASRWSKIQKVPIFLHQNLNFDRYCSPKMISFGPIHHHRQNEDPQLGLGQRFKYHWAFHYIEQVAKEKGMQHEEAKLFLYKIVKGHLPKLRKQFRKDVVEMYIDEELEKMLFVDGCALLYFMDTANDKKPELLMLKLDQLMYIWRDIILLENQLPMELLELLTDDCALQLGDSLFNFLLVGQPKKREELSSLPKHDHQESNHLLDYIRSYYSCTGKSQLDVSPGKKVFWPSLLDTLVPSKLRKAFRSLREAHSWHTYKNIGDLRKAGIGVKTSKAEWKWDNISFTSNWFSGQLMLPGIVVDDIALYLFRNLIAYELCPDFSSNFEFCSYFILMDSLIDDAEDVKELRAAGVLQNLLGSDEEVARLFNELGHILPTQLFDAYKYDNRYVEVKRQIDEHYRNTWKTCVAQLRSTYFNIPWSYITFFAAVFALVLTYLQTWYTIHPVK